MNYEMEGKILKIEDTQTLKNDFTKREFVVETDEQYPQKVKFELIKDKTALVDKFSAGDAVKVSFNIRGSEWNGKYFVNLSAWRVEAAQQNAGAGASAGSATTGGTPGAPVPPPMPAGEPFDPGDASEDDLPF